MGPNIFKTRTQKFGARFQIFEYARDRSDARGSKELSNLMRSNLCLDFLKLNKLLSPFS